MHPPPYPQHMYANLAGNPADFSPTLGTSSSNGGYNSSSEEQVRMHSMQSELQDLKQMVSAMCNQMFTMQAAQHPQTSVAVASMTTDPFFPAAPEAPITSAPTAIAGNTGPRNSASSGCPDLSESFPEVGPDGVPLVFPRNRKNYPHVRVWTKDDYDNASASEATVPGATKRKPGRPSKKTTVEEVWDDDDLNVDNFGGKGASTKAPTHNFKFLMDVWGNVVSDNRVKYARGVARSYWTLSLKDGRAPLTWKRDGTSDTMDDFYRYMKRKVPEFGLADDDWKIELFAILVYPTFVAPRKAQFAALASQRQAYQTATISTKKKRKQKASKNDSGGKSGATAGSVALAPSGQMAPPVQNTDNPAFSGEPLIQMSPGPEDLAMIYDDMMPAPATSDNADDDDDHPRKRRRVDM
ncbi:hypothetical protein C8T65DRAFT_741666 [Cerioporus squamosus]|nr:hypothetical protein C8T65DRAFT_741666 [Cerioporus squamosus]